MIPDDAVDEVGAKLEALCDGTGHDRCCGCSEDDLEHEVTIDGDIVGVSKQEPLARSDEACHVSAVHDSPADCEVRE